MAWKAIRAPISLYYIRRYSLKALMSPKDSGYTRVSFPQQSISLFTRDLWKTILFSVRVRP